jgi:F-type H+-transporting ATPase subunit gamma
MASLKALKNRIGSVKNTQKITRAMKLVAAAKMKRAVDAALESRPYSDEVTAVLQSLMARMDTAGHPLLTPHEDVKKVAVVVITADRGLCGGFNNALLRTVSNFLWDSKRENEAAWDAPELILFGKKARGYFKARGFDWSKSTIDLKPAQFGDEIAALVHDLKTRYEAGDLDEVYLAYNEFVNTLNQEPVVEKLFPLAHLAAEASDEPEHLSDFVYEPSQAAILNHVLPLFLRTRITQVFLESEAGEHAARMTAMENATRNATDVIDKLTLQYNRARQAAITTELVEIVAGAEAL